MPRFRYTAKDNKGGSIKAVEDAASARALAGTLRRRGLVVITIEETRAAAKKTDQETKAKASGKVSTAETADFFRQMATLIDAGIPLVQTLDILVDREENAYLKGILAAVKAEVEAGIPFSNAIEKYQDIFPNYIVAMVEAAEEGGGMANILEKLATYLEELAELSKKLKSASMYPIFIGGFFLCAMIGVVFFLIPQFEEIFSGFDMELPLPTLILMGISRFLTDNILYELGGIIVIGASYSMWAKTPGGKYKIDKIKLKLPVLGGVVQKAIIARFCQTFGILLESGVTVVNALAIAEKTADNLIYEEGIGSVRSGIMGGETIGSEMERTGLFPKMLVSMIATGEQSGTLGPMLSKAATSFKRDVESAILGATSLVEPVMIVGLGIIVAVTVLATYLPIFQMSSGAH
ncbi:MAG: type II secretion system F family protein [Candidatus Latescibacteria bacterium]|jgi:type IV pilus assembly protein PilC|nr:type II secretion system F family protein [Candidatus Latescibacterota bacterium]